MQIYLAAAWSRKSEIKKIADELIALGFNIQARWLDEPSMEQTMGPKFLQRRAEIDEEDIFGCDVLVRFSDDLSQPTVPSYLATGSRMYEMGLARGNGAKIIVVGGHQCVFDYLYDVTHVSDVVELAKTLNRMHMQFYLPPNEWTKEQGL